MAAFKKQYGLIVSKKSPAIGARLSVFDDDDDDDVGSVGLQLQKEGLKAKVKKSTQLALDKAVAQDPTVFEYDKVYDEIETKKKQLQKVKETKEKKPKYIEALMKSAESRKKEQERRVERQVQKEREEEGNEFADKEAFVTTAYKKKMQEMQELEEKEKQEEAMEALTDVTKQKDLSGFYRHMMRQKFGEEPKSSNSSPLAAAECEKAEDSIIAISIKQEKVSDGSASEHEGVDKCKDPEPVTTSTAEMVKRGSSSRSADEEKSESRSRTPKSKDKHHRRQKGKRTSSPDSDDDKSSKRRRHRRHHHKESRKRHSSEDRDESARARKSKSQRKSSSSPDRSNSKHKRVEKNDSLHTKNDKDSCSTQLKKHQDNNRSCESADEKCTDKQKTSSKGSSSSKKNSAKKEQSDKKLKSNSDTSDSEESVVGPAAAPAVKETPEERMQRVFRIRHVGDAVSDARERYLLRKNAREAAKSAFKEVKE